MKKYKLLSVHRKNKRENNVGDYIQALAASQFLPQIDGFINREELKSYNEDESKVIMNGWYMHDTTEWPPSDKIDPLFIAFHVNKSAQKNMLSDEGVEYLRQHEPIGCRDYYTRDLLLQRGIDAYFSGCLTLTLGNNYSSEKHDGPCYIVDPIIPKNTDLISLIKDASFFIQHFASVIRVCKKIYKQKKLKLIFKSSRFLRLYSKIFDMKMLADAIYIEQQSGFYTENFNNDMELLKEAERLVKLYSKAKLVITSRIHCALPCLGINTPVYFLHKPNDSEISSCRFQGLIELFNSIIVSDYGLVTEFDMITKRISPENHVDNKEAWKELALNISNKCKDFINK